MKFSTYRLLLLLSLLSGCEQTETTTSSTEPNNTPIGHVDNSSVKHVSSNSNTSPAINSQFEIENKRYLFDVTANTKEDLSALLIRIDEIMEASPELFNELEIVMVLHGPDINLFTEKNYNMNKELVDLAAKLDAFKVVDMKVCETSMDMLGVTNMEIPPFIETVPFAPDTLDDLREQGYINL